jgi:hypothetical protein
MLLVMICNVTQVVKGSLRFLTCIIFFSINGMEKQKLDAILFKHVESVWEACNNMLKKTPYTNRAIVGQNLSSSHFFQGSVAKY